MYFTDAVKVLLRRWYVLLVGLLLTGGAAVGVALVVPTNYEASGNVLFLLPPDAGDQPVNPYLNVPQGLTMSASIVGGVLSTPEMQRDIFDAGSTSEYAVGQEPGTGIPMLYITAADTDPAMAVKTVAEVIRRVDTELERMQTAAGAPSDQRMVTQPFSVTAQAEVVRGAKIRAVAVVGAVGAVLTVLAAFALDRARPGFGPRRGAHVATAIRSRSREAAAEGPQSPLEDERPPEGDDGHRLGPVADDVTGDSSEEQSGLASASSGSSPR
jgi:hypothetical protein